MKSPLRWSCGNLLESMSRQLAIAVVKVTDDIDLEDGGSHRGARRGWVLGAVGR